MATNIEVSGLVSDPDIRMIPSSSSVNGNSANRVDVPQGLVKRREARMAKLEKAKEQRENEHVKQESAEYFAKKFNAERCRIEDELSGAGDIEKSNLIGFFDDVTDSANKLQSYLTDMSTFLPSYDIRCAQENVTKLLNKINEKRDDLLPKKKFQFKARKRGDTQESKQVKKIGTDQVDSAKSLDITTENACGFSNRTSESLSLTPEEIYMKDISLSNLTSCTIKLLGCPSALHVSNISSCTVLCGPIPGSIFIDKSVDSSFALACQQLRVHNSKDTRFYLHVTSRAIIEDTTRVLFAPYNWTYDGLEEHYRQSGLDRSKNAWDDVDDFNWLASDEHSPNWGLIPEGDRVSQWE